MRSLSEFDSPDHAATRDPFCDVVFGRTVDVGQGCWRSPDRGGRNRHCRGIRQNPSRAKHHRSSPDRAAHFQKHGHMLRKFLHSTRRPYTENLAGALRHVPEPVRQILWVAERMCRDQRGRFRRNIRFQIRLLECRTLRRLGRERAWCAVMRGDQHPSESLLPVRVGARGLLGQQDFLNVQLETFPRPGKCWGGGRRA